MPNKTMNKSEKEKKLNYLRMHDRRNSRIAIAGLLSVDQRIGEDTVWIMIKYKDGNELRLEYYNSSGFNESNNDLQELDKLLSVN